MLQPVRRLAIAIALVLPSVPYAQERVALVIGNSTYKTAPLVNPKNDAKSMGDLLRRAGFSVDQRVDTGQADLHQAIQAFGQKIRDPKVKFGLFYYAGHGLQLEWRNYLVPISADIRTSEDVKKQTVDVSELLNYMEQAKGRSFLVILDACRDDPFAGTYRPSAKGLSQFDAPVGSLLAYATAPGNVALDGEGDNGLYTTSLLQEFAAPGVRLEDAFKRVRLTVRLASKGKQIPWESTSLEEDVYLFPTDRRKLSDAEQEQQLDKELEAWVRVKSSNNIDQLAGFLRQHPSGYVSELAQSRLSRLLSQQAQAEAQPRDRDVVQVAQLERQAREQAQQRAEAEKKAREEAARLAEAEKKAREEAERLALAEQKVREEQARRRAEAERLAREDEGRRQAEVARLAREEEARRLAESERRAREEAVRVAEAARVAREAEARRVAEAERVAREEAERQARAAEAARQEAVRTAQLEATERARRQEEARRVAEAADRARLEAQRQLQAREEEQRRLAEAQRRADDEARRLAETQRQSQEQEARRVAEAERARREAQRVAEAERVARDEQARRDAELAAVERARQEAVRLAEAAKAAREAEDRKAAELQRQQQALLAQAQSAATPVAAAQPVQLAATPFSAGYVEHDRKYAVGDIHQFRVVDSLTKVEKPFQLSVTAVDMDGDKVEFNGGEYQSDLMGNITTNARGTLSGPRQFYPAELFVGKRWQTMFKQLRPSGITYTFKYDVKVVGREKITVPAGTFDTFRIEARGFNLQLGASLTRTIWVAPGVAADIAHETQVRLRNNMIEQYERQELVALRKAGGTAQR